MEEQYEDSFKERTLKAAHKVEDELDNNQTQTVQPPKRNWPAFFFFQREQLPKYKEQNPNLSHRECVKKMGEMWRGLSETEKQPYIDQEKQDKARYLKEKELYMQENKGSIWDKSKQVRTRKQRKGPIRAWPPFFYFHKQRRGEIKEENPTLNHREIVAKLGAEWRALSDEQKKPFVELSKQDELRYEREKEGFDTKETSSETIPSSMQSKINLRNDQEDNQDLSECAGEEDKEDESRSKEVSQTSEKKSELPLAQDSTRCDKDRVQRRSKSGPKKPMSPFFQFSKSRREQLKQQNPDLSIKEVTMLLAQEWRALTPEAKSQFEELAAKDKERYEREKKELNQSETSEGEAQKSLLQKKAKPMQ
ncbi:unnamed protein product [Moneuplotes crassus]|uniref:HMG box domain-containing protein n=1 Tax=Euplotes crassus TaxID=5936 RepID=A0AAD1UE47_EUPCR|nr:unnamed protein product [Moneuplotes crassus]